MKEKIAEKLKELRGDLDYSTEYVADLLKKWNFSIKPNTIYNYENGVSQPKADMFLCLCRIYNISSFDIFFDDKPQVGTNPQDKKILTAYRHHPEMQPAINKMLDIEIDEKKDMDYDKEIRIAAETPVSVQPISDDEIHHS